MPLAGTAGPIEKRGSFAQGALLLNNQWSIFIININISSTLNDMRRKILCDLIYVCVSCTCIRLTLHAQQNVSHRTVAVVQWCDARHYLRDFSAQVYVPQTIFFNHISRYRSRVKDGIGTMLTLISLLMLSLSVCEVVWFAVCNEVA